MAIFAALLISMSASAALNLNERAAFREACELSRYTCKGIRPPWVRESIFVDKVGAWGYYFGGRTIWLSPNLTTEQRYIVMVNEMVHYLQVYEDEKGFPQTAPGESCVREEEAYEISDKVVRRLGLQDKIPLRLNLLRAQCV